MKPSTRAAFDCALGRHILVLGDLKLADISPLHIENFARSKLDSQDRPKDAVELAEIESRHFLPGSGQRSGTAVTGAQEAQTSDTSLGKDRVDARAGKGDSERNSFELASSVRLCRS